MDYDIYLRDVCRIEPDLDDLQVGIPALGEAVIQAKLTIYPLTPNNNWIPQRHPPRPGFLGLNVEEATAHELYRRLATARAQGEVLPVSYRDPKITEEQAQKIAEEELRRICKKDFPTLDISPVSLWEVLPRWWVFYAVLKGLPKRGRIIGPGGPMVYIDRVDGHVVEDEEICAAYKEKP